VVVYNESIDGIDTLMQVNVFAQNLIVGMLLSVLFRTPNSRIVLQSSELHRMAPSDVQFASLAEINRDIGPSYLYSRSQLAQVLTICYLVKQLGEELKAGPTFINATHPGAITTDQPRQAEEAYGILGKIGTTISRPSMNDPVKQGCRPALYAATSEEVVEQGIHGVYIVPDKKFTEPSSQALDDALAENLWKLNKKVLREKVGDLPFESI